MSWLFSSALVERNYPQIFGHGESSAQLNVMPTPHPFWRNDKTMEFSTPSKFGLTCKVLTQDLGEELLNAFLRDSHARTSASQALALVYQGREAGYGNTPSGLLATWEPKKSSWRTAQCSLFEDSEQSLEIWPRQGSMRSGVCYQRPPLEPSIYAKESGLWPTPTARDYKDGWAPRYREGKLQLDTLGRALGGPPNPQFSEWLMGWPIGWTELSPLAMDKFQEWQQQHSLCLQNEQGLSEVAA